MRVLTPEQTPEQSNLPTTNGAGLAFTEAATPCRSYDPELWFAERPDQVTLAQNLCRICPLRDTCLSGALEREEPWGVWGGELFEYGVPVARKRRPGRPRKDDHLDRTAAEQALASRLSAYDDLTEVVDTDGFEAELAALTGSDLVPAPRQGGVAA